MDIIIETTIGEKIVNPEIVKVIVENGYCVVSKEQMNQYNADSLELVKLKLKIKEGKI